MVSSSLTCGNEDKKRNLPLHDQLKNVAVVILAAGRGVRMKSTTPKVLHKVAGLPMIQIVYNSCQIAGLGDTCVVVGPELEARVDEIIQSKKNVAFAVQRERQGTADAVASASVCFKNIPKPSYNTSDKLSGPEISAEYCLIVPGDCPLVEPNVLKEFVSYCLYQENNSLGVIGMNIKNPSGYGRLILDQNGLLEKVVEEKDASEEQKKVKLCNTGVIFAEVKALFECLSRITNDNRSSEYYLTDCFELFRQSQNAATVFQTQGQDSFLGVNNPHQIAAVEKLLIQRIVQQFQEQGVRFLLPETCYIETNVIIEAGAKIWPFCTLKGNTIIESGASIGSRVSLENCHIGRSAVVEDGCVLKGRTIGENERVEPLTVKGY